ncbi:hypothetical protein DAPPUDRAFT_123560, partial [Daphnia pulex]
LNSGKSSIKDDVELRAPECPAGTDYVPLSLAEPPDPNVEFTPKEAIKDSRTFLWPTGSETALQLRVDTCIDNNDNFRVLRIVSRQDTSGVKQTVYEEFKADSGIKAEGILEALNGDVSKLLIFVPKSSPGGASFKITGTVVGGDQLTYIFKAWESDPEKAEARVFTFGTLISANPWAGEGEGDGEGPCSEDKTLQQYRYLVKTSNGEIDFTVVGCEFESFGTRRLEWRKAWLKDSGAPAGFANKVFTFTPDANSETSRFDYRFTHHNACEWHSFILPHASYGMTGAHRPGNIGGDSTECEQKGFAPRTKLEENVGFAFAYGGQPTFIERSILK